MHNKTAGIPLKYNVRSLLQRKTRSILTVVGIAAVVAIFVAMVAFGNGMSHSFSAVGSDDNVAVLQKGAFSAALSSVPRSTRDVVTYLPEIKKDGDHTLVSPELVVEPWVSVPGKKQDVFMMARGVEPVFFKVEDQIHILSGSSELRGNRVLLGRQAQRKLGGIGSGHTLLMHGETWTVVGIFTSDGTALESAILTDLADLMRAAKRDEYSGYTIKAANPANVPSLVARLNSDQRTSITAMREPEYYSSSGTIFAFVGRLALLISVVVTIGAVFGGMNTMYTAVSGRFREIGTLRSLGFSRGSILISFLSESLLLSMTGGLFGVLAGSWVDGLQMGIVNASIQFRVSAGIIALGLLVSAVIGIAGGFLPAYGAARSHIIDSLRRV